MGSIIKKKIKNGLYYYYAESKRVNGKPTLVNQKYLGTAEQLLSKVLTAQTPLQERVIDSLVYDFGAVALLYDIADRLDIVSVIDNFVPKRKQGASVGMYLLTEVINRAVNPKTTSKLEDWFSRTCLPQITGIPAKAFTAQNFWNNTKISEEVIQNIEDVLLKKIIETYEIDCSHLIYDATNFFTYIDTNQPCQTAKRGNCKQKRKDLRIVGLSLMVSTDFSIPLLHETYPGNRADSVQFPLMIQSLKQRYERITGKKSDVTVVFDRGNNSQDNIDILESGDMPFHYVGGLKRNQASELFAISKSEYTALNPEKFPGHSAYRKKIKAFNREVTAVIVYNEELERGQMQGVLHNIEKTTQLLLEEQKRLIMRANKEITGGKKPTKESITNKINKILKKEYMSEIFSWEILEKEEDFYLSFGESKDALSNLCERELGKTALFTDRDDMTDEEIIGAYRSAWHVESGFRQLKDTSHLTVRPFHHWTDEKIRIHMFSCVLAYRLCCLLQKELAGYGITASLDMFLEEMATLQKVTTFFKAEKKPEVVESFTSGSPFAQAVDCIYQLKEKYS